MSKSSSALEITPIDPREPEAAALIRAMTAEVTKTYDHKIDGAGTSSPKMCWCPAADFSWGA